MSFIVQSKRFLNLAIISVLVVSCAEASAAEAPIALAPVGVTINTNTPPPTPRVSPTVRPPTQPPTRTLVPTLRPANTLAPIGRPPVRPAVQAVAPTSTFTAVPQTARNGTIREIEVESDVLSKLNANASEGSALLGQKITSGGTVRTLDRGKARIDLNEGTVVRVAPKTLFTVTELNQDSLNPFTRLSLTFGKIFIVLTGGRMEVETPVGAASVRGSFMSVEFNAALRQLTINCLETAFNCDLSYQGTIFNLLTLQKMIVPPFPPRIQPMDAVDIKEWLINVPNSPTVIAPTATNPVPTSQPPAPPAPTATATNTPALNIVVNTLTDELNNNGNCSLREAIKAANTNLPVDACIPTGGSDTITFSV
ncbi:MAG: CSLREA domain-containing protein, partial [Chloroflexota bacterium]